MTQGVEPRSFTCSSLERVHFGPGSKAELANEAQRYGCSRVFIVTGRSIAERSPYLASVETILGDRVAGVFTRASAHSPLGDVLEAAEDARSRNADLIVSLGGGSAVDTAKMIVLCLAEDARERDEILKLRMRLMNGKPVAAPGRGQAIPHIAMPTTLSGAEFSSYAGSTDETTGAKDQYKHAGLAPRVVIQDPELTQATPAWLWGSTGVRAIDHCVEAIYSKQHQPFSDALALQALKLLSQKLVRSAENPDDLDARVKCQNAAWLSLYSLGNMMVGLSHAIGHQLGGRCKVPHGVTSCLMLAAVMDYNRPASADRQALAASALGVSSAGLSDDEAASEAAEAVRDIVQRLGIKRRLRDWNVTKEELPKLAEGTMTEFCWPPTRERSSPRMKFMRSCRAGSRKAVSSRVPTDFRPGSMLPLELRQRALNRRVRLTPGLRRGLAIRAK